MMAAMDPLCVAAIACLCSAALCWLLGVITREHSWVDRLWSILPPLYVGWFASHAAGDARLRVMTVLAALWGARLTFNFARKGGYRPGGEDYRWAELRRRMPPGLYAVFHAVFIALIQNVLLLLLALPAHVALVQQAPWGPLDTLATIVFLGFLLGETIADRQQWDFQREKLARGAGHGPQFLTRGLFRYSRHPNFFCEMGMWWTFSLFAVAAGGGWIHEGVIGPVLLTLLFHGSTAFTEQLSRAKYPAYADYQRSTSRLVPWFPRR
jgi:steroid 5-alpha reductase family enzyme